MGSLPESQAVAVRRFLEAIRDRYGYDFSGYSEPSMTRRVLAALERSNVHRIEDLHARVMSDPALFAHVVEDFTVRVSEFFRDPELFLTLRSAVVPVLKTYPFLKVWHGGCATGEEVYSSAIMLTEEGLYERTQLYATDLSVRAIDAARRGVYPLEDVRAYARNFEQSGGRAPFFTYFAQATERGVAVHESLKRNVTFFQHDLIADQPLGEMHVVFCRNVFIYFGAELRRQVMAKLMQSLIPGGFLVLGATEHLSSDEMGGRFTELNGMHRLYRYEG